MDDLDKREHRCPVCRKRFIVPTEEWAYKRLYDHHVRYFCSWGCLNKHELTRPKKVAGRELDRMIEMLRAGKSDTEIVRTLGVDRSKVRYWMERTAKGE